MNYSGSRNRGQWRDSIAIRTHIQAEDMLHHDMVHEGVREQYQDRRRFSKPINTDGTRIITFCIILQSALPKGENSRG